MSWPTWGEFADIVQSAYLLALTVALVIHTRNCRYKHEQPDMADLERTTKQWSDGKQIYRACGAFPKCRHQGACLTTPPRTVDREGNVE